MKNKDLKINFRYLIGNIACLTVDSISGKTVHNDINNEEAIIIFNSLVGEKENCRTVKTLLEENIELKKQLEERSKDYCNASNIKHNYAKKLVIIQNQQQEFIKYLEDEINRLKNNHEHLVVDMFGSYDLNDIELKLLKEILQKHKEIIGVSDENKTTI